MYNPSPQPQSITSHVARICPTINGLNTAYAYDQVAQSVYRTELGQVSRGGEFCEASLRRWSCYRHLPRCDPGTTYYPQVRLTTITIFNNYNQTCRRVCNSLIDECRADEDCNADIYSSDNSDCSAGDRLRGGFNAFFLLVILAILAVYY